MAESWTQRTVRREAEKRGKRGMVGLAEDVGIDRTTLLKWRNGSNAGWELLNKFCEAIGKYPPGMGASGSLILETPAKYEDPEMLRELQELRQENESLRTLVEAGNSLASGVAAMVEAIEALRGPLQGYVAKKKVVRLGGGGEDAGVGGGARGELAGGGCGAGGSGESGDAFLPAMWGGGGAGVEGCGKFGVGVGVVGSGVFAWAGLFGVAEWGGALGVSGMRERGGDSGGVADCGAGVGGFAWAGWGWRGVTVYPRKVKGGVVWWIDYSVDGVRHRERLLGARTRAEARRLAELRLGRVGTARELGVAVEALGGPRMGPG